MKALSKLPLKEKISSAYIFILRYIFSSFIVFTAAFILLKFPSYSIEGVKRGISICFDSLIPTLYPFMIITDIFISSRAADFKIPFLERLCRFLFRLPAGALSVIIFSLIGGLPIGARMSSELYERGLISKGQYARLICFCVNPGPAFVISAVGATMLGSEKTGLIIYASLVLSSLIIGIMSRFFTYDNETVICNADSDVITHRGGAIIEKSVAKSSRAILSVCSWVVAFSCVSEFIDGFVGSEGAKSFLICLTEMTRGCLVVSESYPAPIVSAVIGFSGICGHLQVMSAVRESGLKYKYFLVGRIINSGLSAVICGLLLKLFPVASETFSVGTRPQSATTSGSVLLSALMIIMAVLFVLGDDYRVTRKKV